MPSRPGVLMIVGGDGDREVFWQTAAAFTQRIGGPQRIAVLCEEFQAWEKWLPEHKERWTALGYRDIELFLPRVREQVLRKRGD